MFGQANHFQLYAKEKIPYAIERYVNESKRLLRVLNTRLADREFVAGAYSIADIMSYTWVLSARERLMTDPAEYAHVVRWLDAITARPAVVRAYALTQAVLPLTLDDEARKHLFSDPDKR
jgi:GST-like protein